MNLILLLPEDFVGESRVSLRGRRLRHVLEVHRASVGDSLTIGVLDGMIGKGVVTRLDADALELDVELGSEPPPALPVTLVLALPRPKVLNRVLLSAASMGVKRLFLINAWRVEKAFWSSPRLSAENIREQLILGLEQSRDTAMPVVETRRFFRQFVEDELPEFAASSMALVAHPGAEEELPRAALGPLTLVIGPEGGFIAEELGSLERSGCRAVTLGARILRVETAVPAILGRLF